MKGDLVALVADKDIENTVRGLLQRPRSLGIRDIRDSLLRAHPLHDPGLFKNGPELLQLYARDYEHALLVLDQDWSGALEAMEMERALDERLHRTWKGCAKAICISPEVEAWVWSDSPHVASELGWDGMEALRAWLRDQGYWKPGATKPANPKGAFRAALKQRGIPVSSAIFRNLAEKVSVKRCQDGSFARLLHQLRDWFPREG